MQRTRIKICGITRPEDLRAAVALGADALGFVFYPKSPRYVTPAQAAELCAALPPYVSAVALFVNATVDEVRAVAQQAPLALIQFHGDETAERCAELAAAVGAWEEAIEDFILTDTNLVAIKGTPEFERNKAVDTPTHRLLTSLFSRERVAFLLQYAFAWLKTEGGIEKHVMRYPQLFATRAIVAIYS